MKNAGSDHYVLRGGDAGATRLRLLARVMWPTTQALFHRVGLRKGMRCLDVGCGIGDVTRKMARWAGETGKVVGIDIDARCVELAQQKSARNQPRPEFRVGGIGDLQEPAVFDLTYGRFLLTHLPEPGSGIHAMMQATRSGGIVVVEDVDFAGHFCFPACPAFDRYVTLYQEVVRRKGGDPNIGPRLLSLFTDGGLEILGLNVVQPTFHEGLGKQIAPITMEHIRESVAGAGLVSNKEVDAIVSELDAFVRNPRTIVSLPRIFQVWGQKPGAS